MWREEEGSGGEGGESGRYQCTGPDPCCSAGARIDERGGVDVGGGEGYEG